MARRTEEKKDLPTRNYQYRVWMPHTRHRTTAEDVAKLALMETIMRHAHRFRNKLIALERWRVQETDKIVHRFGPGLAPLKAEAILREKALAELVAGLKEKNQKSRRKRTTTPEQLAVQAARKAADDASKAYFAARKPVYKDPQFEEWQEKLAEEVAKQTAAMREQAKATGVFWGSYLLQEDAMEAAQISKKSKNTKKKSKRRRIEEHDLPRFRRYDDQGAIGAQIQGGMVIEDVCTGVHDQGHFWIDPPPPEAYWEGVPKSARRAVAFIRIGPMDQFDPVTRKRAKPIWLRLPFLMERQIPPGSMVKNAKVMRERVGAHWRWTLQIAITREEGFEPRVPSAGTGKVAIDVGWRLLAENGEVTGIRVATWYSGKDERSDELIIPKERLDMWAKVDELRSTRDTNFNTAKAQFLAWAALATLPEWLQDRVEYLPQWRSVRKLSKLVDDWRTRRFAGDEMIFEVMEFWRKRDKHLHLWEGDLRDQLLAWRDDLYRIFVNHHTTGLRMHYETAIVEKLDWAELQKDLPPELNVSQEQIKKYRRMAAVGRLVALIKEGMPLTVLEAPEFTTQRCHACHKIERFDKARELVHTCSHCETTWDQDLNAAINLYQLAEGLMAPITVGAPVPV